MGRKKIFEACAWGATIVALMGFLVWLELKPIDGPRTFREMRAEVARLRREVDAAQLERLRAEVEALRAAIEAKR